MPLGLWIGCRPLAGPAAVKVGRIPSMHSPGSSPILLSARNGASASADRMLPLCIQHWPALIQWLRSVTCNLAQPQSLHQRRRPSKPPTLLLKWQTSQPATLSAP